MQNKKETMKVQQYDFWRACKYPGRSRDVIIAELEALGSTDEMVRITDEDAIKLGAEYFMGLHKQKNKNSEEETSLTNSTDEELNNEDDDLI